MSHPGCVYVVASYPSCPKCGKSMETLRYLGSDSGIFIPPAGLWAICLSCMVLKQRTH
jgi:hypothetical protein